jgi:hypothetical protein
MNRLFISDDGDEVVFFDYGDKRIGFVDHGGSGWEGMTETIRLITRLCKEVGIEVVDEQSIV